MARKPTLYLVEDNSDIRRVFSLLLDARGFETFEFSMASDALAAFSNQVPDAALIDIGLPDLNGWELAKRIRQIPGSEDVVMAALTGRTDEQSQAKSMAAGFQIHFVKPVEISEVCLELFSKLKPTHHQNAA